MTAESPAAAACSGPLQPLAEYSLVQYSLHSIGFERPVLTGRMAPRSFDTTFRGMTKRQLEELLRV